MATAVSGVTSLFTIMWSGRCCDVVHTRTRNSRRWQPQRPGRGAWPWAAAKKGAVIAADSVLWRPGERNATACHHRLDRRNYDNRACRRSRRNVSEGMTRRNWLPTSQQDNVVNRLKMCHRFLKEDTHLQTNNYQTSWQSWTLLTIPMSFPTYTFLCLPEHSEFARVRAVTVTWTW